MKQFLMAGTALAFIAACAPAGEDTAADTTPANTEVETAQVGVGDPSTGTPRLGTWGIETQNVDAAIHPGDDFNRFVNEAWLQNTEIPTGFSRFGSFTELYLLSEERIEAENPIEGFREKLPLAGAAIAFMVNNHINLTLFFF